MNAGVLYAKYAARLCYVKNGGISQSELLTTCYIKHGISKYTECVYVRVRVGGASTLLLIPLESNLKVIINVLEISALSPSAHRRLPYVYLLTK